MIILFHDHSKNLIIYFEIRMSNIKNKKKDDRVGDHENSLQFITKINMCIIFFKESKVI